MSVAAKRQSALNVVALTAWAVAAAPTVHAAPPQPGGGDEFFIYEIGLVTPPPAEAAVRAIIPLAHQVCDARANGQDDLQATALDIVGVATLAYCPQHNNGNW